MHADSSSYMLSRLANLFPLSSMYSLCRNYIQSKYLPINLCHGKNQNVWNCLRSKFKLFATHSATSFKVTASKCLTIGWHFVIFSPFPNKDKNFLGSYATTTTFLRKFYSFTASRPACPLRKCEMVRPSYWDMPFKHFYSWPLLHNESYCNVEGCAYLLGIKLRFPQDNQRPFAPFNNCPCLMQPRAPAAPSKVSTGGFVSSTIMKNV